LPTLINKKADFNEYGGLGFTESEQWFKMIKLDPHIFTDTGYRFQQNIYEQGNYWYWPIKNESEF